MNELTILSLFDFSRNWPKYFEEAGYKVISVDLIMNHNGGIKADILNWQPPFEHCYGVLAAPPCTHFSIAGNYLWKQKDLDGSTELARRLVLKTLQLIEFLKPTFWVLENPATGRILKVVPELGPSKHIFHPYEYAGYSSNPLDEAYTKKTALWGNFKMGPKSPIDVPRRSRLGRKSWNFVDNAPRFMRSITPLGFAKATFIGNHIDQA